MLKRIIAVFTIVVLMVSTVGLQVLAASELPTFILEVDAKAQEIAAEEGYTYLGIEEVYGSAGNFFGWMSVAEKDGIKCYFNGDEKGGMFGDVELFGFTGMGIIPGTEPTTSNELIVIVMNIGNPLMRVNDEEVEIDPGRGTTPIELNGRTMLPIRAIWEAIGGEVQWEESTQQVTLIRGTTTIIMNIDNPTMNVNGIEMEIDPGRGTVPIELNGRTLVPIRAPIEEIGGTVEWEDATQQITLKIS